MEGARVRFANSADFGWAIFDEISRRGRVRVRLLTAIRPHRMRLSIGVTLIEQVCVVYRLNRGCTAALLDVLFNLDVKIAIAKIGPSDGRRKLVGWTRKRQLSGTSPPCLFSICRIANISISHDRNSTRACPRAMESNRGNGDNQTT